MLLGRILITVGTALVLAALFADVFLARHPHFAWFQGLGVVGGVVVILVGTYLWSRGNTTP